MSKLTESLDQTGDELPDVSSWRGELLCLQPEWQTASQPAREKRWSVPDLQAHIETPATLVVLRDTPPEGAQSYRGHRYWVVGPESQHCADVMPLLEEFSVRDMRPAQQAQLIESVKKAAQETGIQPFETGWEELVSRIGRALEDHPTLLEPARQKKSTTERGLVFLDGLGNGAVWAPAGHHALIVLSGGGTSLAAWTADPVTTLQQWIDGERSPESGCTRPDHVDLPS